MHFEKDCLYHVYNRSNKTVFINRDNYLFFLKKIRAQVKPKCDILAWCLMPNHFHFLIRATSVSIALHDPNNSVKTQKLAKAWGSALSSYTQAYNNKFAHRGSLWAHKTKAIMINDKSEHYGIICFQYIHQNPLGLVAKMEDWEYSSYKDFIGKRNGTLINKQLAFDMLNLDDNNVKAQSEVLLEEKDVKHIW